MKKLLILLLFASSIAAANPLSKPIVAQFFGIWTNRGQNWEEKFRDDTPFEKLTRLYVAFGKIIKTTDGHFSIDFDGDVAHVKAIMERMKKSNPNAEIFLSVGGDDDKDSYGGAVNDPQFFANVKNFLTQYGFNGFDIDWEMWLNKEDLNALVTQLYATLHSAGYKLTLDVWPFVSSAYDMPVLKNNLDQMNIMSYGAGRKLPTIVAQFETAGFPTEKLIGGIETERNYREGGVDTLGPTGTIVEKATFALQHGLAGMMEWRLDNDYATSEKPNYPTYQGADDLWATMNG